ncbi:TonB-dependent receptor [Galbibacter pacificus]|uniref:TonB-dependent receptor n=1 Tax=Galbibacter pacificus TaxID=2996052 RepID=A0ABT6FN63_9FLAO|nr:TonB-dependent receptor [Galbibacter pacificus]MDG3581226.1 TonB-dependent receptor [Galbibacter pacificus]MDG3584704.1 TonB-dependent receptor [Galbibacter pacificus]
MQTLIPRTIILIGSLLLGFFSFPQQGKTTVSGVVKDTNDKPIYGATVLVEPLNKGVSTDEQGYFQLSIGTGNGSYTLRVTYLGFDEKRVPIELGQTGESPYNIVLEESSYDLDEVVVSGKSIVNQVKEKAFNVNVIDAKKLHNTTLDLGHALDRTSGIRVRESGGVGSQMNFSLNGFRGKQVRFFIDGIPMDNFGSSFQLNNIPVNLAERVEVYKGVVPIGLGADALGGAVNIITNTYEKSHLDASYSYGSFNTHRSMVNAIYVSKSGFTAQLNAYQNYSDNNYDVTVDVADINTGEYYPDQTVERFHDKYHNETVIANIGVVNKSYADQLLLGVTTGSSYREIQTGARIVSVFGAWHRKGNILMPSLKYIKKDFIANGLDVRLNANYNFGQEKNIDTLHRRYNWFGQYKEYDNPGGERSYSLYEYRNNTGIATASFDYELSQNHKFSLSNTFNTFNRKGEDQLDPDSEIYEQPRKTIKNILGLGYGYEAENWSANIFAKQYFQQNKFSQSYNPSGDYGDIAYRDQTNKFSYLGYGLALTHFFNDDFQIKASFEKSYRMPETEELYGDLVNLQGNIDLKPEQSYNYNLGASYWWHMGTQHHINLNANGFYRDASDFIRPVLNNNQTMQVMDNLGSVTNLGIESEIRYQYREKFSAGVNVTYQNLRNNTKYEGGQTTESVVYRDRIPNMPYLYGNADMSYTFQNVGGTGNLLSIGYNMLYVHAFYLYWPSLGDDKFDIPEQISQDFNITYTWKEDLQFTFECRNIFNKKLYDNFSLQKPGRSFTGKIRYTFF